MTRAVYFAVARGNAPGMKRTTPFFWAAWIGEPPQRDPFTSAAAFGNACDDTDARRQVEQLAPGHDIVMLQPEWARAARHAKLGHLPWPEQRRAQEKQAEEECRARNAAFEAKIPAFDGARRLGLPPFDRLRRIPDGQLHTITDPELRDAVLFELQCRIHETRKRFEASITLGADPLAVLGLQKPCTNHDIKLAFRRLVLVHHPDRGGDTAKFREIKAAYDALTGARDE